MEQRKVYNLEFPDFCERMDVCGFTFSRVKTYKDRLREMHQPINFHSEFPVGRNLGRHSHTGYVDIPGELRNSAVFPDRNGATELDDIQLLLSLFSSRNVFSIPCDVDEIATRIDQIDHRQFRWGGVLATSIPYTPRPVTCDRVVSQESEYDARYETHLPVIIERMRSDPWQQEYRHGYYLLLARQAFQQFDLTSAFTHSWTLWEHLFTIYNDSSMSERELLQTPGPEKIGDILVRYALRNEIAQEEHRRIIELSRIRNRLLHYGQLPEREHVADDAMMFIRMTEFVVARSLGLNPSDIFNTIERFEAFIQSARNGNQVA